MHFQYFFINLPMLTTSETLSADAGCGRMPNAGCIPCGRPPMQKPAEGGMSCSWGAAWLWGTYIWWRRLLDALFLTSENFANFQSSQEWGNGRCPSVCNHQPAVYLIVYKVCQRCDIHTGVGFCVARSTGLGNAKAFRCGTSNRYRLPRFFHRQDYKPIACCSGGYAAYK